MDRTTAMRRALGAAATLTAMFAVAACSGSHNNSSTPNRNSGSTQTTAPAAPAGVPSPRSSAVFNDADVQFAQAMIPHHQQAVKMAELAASRGADAELVSIAAQIKEQQNPEITTMTSMLTSWGKPTTPGSADPEASPSASTPSEDDDSIDTPQQSPKEISGMASDQDMSALENATGADFDRMFAEMMIAHHNGSIQAAKDEQSGGSNQQAKELAAAIETGQASEVLRLQAILDRL